MIPEDSSTEGQKTPNGYVSMLVRAGRRGAPAPSLGAFRAGEVV
jgi:hypothetical protein